MTPERLTQLTHTMADALAPLTPSNQEMVGVFATVLAALVLAAPKDVPPTAALDRTLAAIRSAVLPHLPSLH
jgi:hypothetical protein